MYLFRGALVFSTSGSRQTGVQRLPADAELACQGRLLLACLNPGAQLLDLGGRQRLLLPRVNTLAPVCGQRWREVSVHPIPDAQGALDAQGHELPIRTEREGFHPDTVAGQNLEDLARGSVMDGQRAVKA